MRGSRGVLALLAAGVIVAAGMAPSMAEPQDKIAVCHKPGTIDEKTLTVAEPAGRAHQRHGDTLGPCLVDEFIDADGIATAGDGLPEALDVEAGDVLTSFPAPGDAGLDMFDRDGDNAWTQGVDDLHSEGTGVCSTAIRDGVHQLGADCKVLDLDGDLTTGDRVTCDLEVGASFGQSPCPPPDVTFFDANSSSTWESGEDIVLDTNGNGVLD